MSTTQAALDAFHVPTETDEEDTPPEDTERRESPYAARAKARIAATKRGEAPEPVREDIPHWRHDGLAAREGSE